MRARAVWMAIAVLGMAARAGAQAPPFEIMDNSFLLEEAFNQERGIIQNIASWTLSDGDWDATFTQEWPLKGQRHQFSYTIPFAAVDQTSGIGDVLLNYRYQVATESSRRPAIAPRVSIVLPTSRDGIGTGAAGLQVNAAVSKQQNDLYFHWNAGFTWLPRVENGGNANGRVSLMSPQVGASGIWRVSPVFNLLLEAIALWEESVSESRLPPVHHASITVSPGFRRGWNVGKAQMVAGAAVPFTRVEGETTPALLMYFSYEGPF